MTSSADTTCYTVVFENAAEYPSTNDLRSALQKGSDEVKIDTLRKIIISTINGNPQARSQKTHRKLMDVQPTLMMPIIQYVLTCLHFYWEVCPKYDEHGKLKQEMILVVNAIRNDLQHPNEYIRGATLRFLTKISKDAELLEPLIPTCRSCLEHRHSYVRKNAVFALTSSLDAAELMGAFLGAETDSACKRNAFVFLAHASMDKAVEYILNIGDGIGGLDEALQMSIIEVIRQDCKNDSAHRPRYIRGIFELLNASSHAVKYEAATTLTTLTQNPAAVKAAASGFINLVIKESDNNVKLIVLDRLEQLRAKHDHVLDGLIMDVLQVLSHSTDIEVRRKAIGIVLSMTSSRNVEEVLQRTQEGGEAGQQEKNPEYRQLLIQSIHVTAVKFSEVAASVVHALMDFLGDSSNPSALDVVAFVREVVEKFPHLRASITSKLVGTLTEIKSGKVFRGVLWIVGEYAEEAEGIQEAMGAVRKVIGEIPILASEQRLLDEANGGADDGEGGEDKEKEKAAASRPKVNADGTSTGERQVGAVRAAAKPPLRTLILGGDFFTGSVLAAALTKLVLRFNGLSSDSVASNTLRAESMLIMASIIRVGQSKFVSVPIDEDSNERIMNCIQTLSELNVAQTEKAVREAFLDDTKEAYTRMLGAQEKRAAEKKQAEAEKKVTVQVDDLLSFRTATGASEGLKEDFMSNLSRISQLTGFSDPIYAEALVKMHGFDIMLDVLLVNQTANTLQNLCLDFATLGDLKIVGEAECSIRATVKVSSTETGVIFGSILWEGKDMGESCVILNDIHVDIMDYIKPAWCNEAQFRSMWTEFEWENRVNVNSTLSDPRDYLKHVMKTTNMSCLTPDGALSGDCDFLSANMYARSLFGEDALANLSIERTEQGTITGHVRIRSKTQGIALSLGDRITMAQKEAKPIAG
ncbi:coatomer beta subunit [Coprinellus micaceus]|uniref:Coatomer subunit beta n=1 Tax=Coprinellus micaceus TaxID=71717 RepID=A0A4Y7TFX5_COPMI|nr:coatomer beta subunit [Coprinellus micaceus]